MNKVTISAVFAMLVPLSACGGGGSSSGSSGSASRQQSTPVASVPAPASYPTPQPNPVIIDAEGDSLIWGFQRVNGENIQSPDNPPAVLQSLMWAQFGGSVTVQDNAVVGSAAFESLDGLSPFYTTSLAERVASNPAHIVLSDYATNDSVERTTTQYLADMTSWVNTVRAAGKIAVLEEPNPTCGTARPNLDAYVQAMDYVAQTMNVPLIQQYNYILGLPNWQSMLGSDCIHPDDQLYEIKAQREYEVLVPIVTSLQ
jgi:acyl-CoA thioesterase-1